MRAQQVIKIFILLISAAQKAGAQTPNFSGLPLPAATPSATSQAIQQDEVERAKEWLKEIIKKQKAPSSLPNPVMDGFRCVENCGNNAGYFDVIINEK